MAAGMAAGETKGKTDTAAIMPQKGFDIETIAEVTGLSAEEIRALRPLQ